MDLSRLIDEAVRAAVQRELASRVQGVALARVLELNDLGCTLEYLTLNHAGPSPTARIATPMAGDGRGVFFRPEPGDEVVVAFHDGDISQPYVIGALWSGADRPPEGADLGNSNNVRSIRSRSGHEVTLDDSPGRGRVVIRAKGGVEITLEDMGRRININTTGVIATSQLVLDGVSWNHIHATGVGPSGPPVSLIPPVPQP